MDRLVEPIVKKPFNRAEILKYGDKLEISGMLLANGQESELILFPEASIVPMDIIQPTHEEWKDLLYQLDTLGVMSLAKIVLRKSQRNIEQTVSWNVFRGDDYTCQYCARNDVPLTVDHIVLWENMGASVEANLISACKKCNKTRGNLDFLDWMKSEYFNRVMDAGWAIPNHELDIPLVKRDHLMKRYAEALKVPLRNTQRNR